MKRLLIIGVILFSGCGMHVPRYHGPQLSPGEWLQACPSGERCSLAEWRPPRQAFPPDYSQAEWHCPQNFAYAPWIGVSDRWVPDPRMPMICLDRRPGSSQTYVALTPLGKGLCHAGVLKLFGSYSWKNCKNEEKP